MSNITPAVRNKILAPLARAGDSAAREKLITLNQPLVHHLVERHIKAFPHLTYLQDEMLSDGTVALVEAVNNISNSAKDVVNSPSSYIGSYIKSAIAETADKNAGIGLNSRHARKLRQEGRFDSVPSVVGFEEEHDISHRDKAAELAEEFAACAENDAERTMLAMLAEGFTMREIAQKTKAGESTLYAARQRIYIKFIQRNPEYTKQLLQRNAA